tara:strand:- start:1682 stop:1831 length:150 start_codon:yes stop_codon:yes gene_type:complete
LKNKKKYEQSDLEDIISDTYVRNAVNYLCHLHPNNYELGAAIRKHFEIL